MVRFPFYARLALTLFAIALIFAFMWVGKSVLVPLFFSFLVAILLHPLVKFFEKKRFPRALAAVTALLIFMILLGGLFYFFSHQVVRLSRDLPSLQAKVMDKWEEIQDWISDKYHITNTQQVAYVNKSANGILNSAMNSVATTFVGIAETLILTIFFFIFTFFILQYRRLLMRFVVELFDHEHNEKVQVIIIRIRSLINGYVVGLLIEMSVVAVLIFVSLMMIGVKYALLISIMAAVLNIIPYLGIYSCMAIAMIITAATGYHGTGSGCCHRVSCHTFCRCQCDSASCCRRQSKNESFYHHSRCIDRSSRLGHSGNVFIYSTYCHPAPHQ